MDFAPSARGAEYAGAAAGVHGRARLPGRAGVRRAARELTAAGAPHDLPAGRRGPQGRGPRARAVEPVPARRRRAGLSVLDYAPLAELTGRSPELAPEAINCAAPDTGNMEVLHLFGTAEQKERWLRAAAGRRDPLGLRDDRAGRRLLATRRNIATRIERDGDEYVINGRKWWTTGAADPRCQILIVMGKTDPDAPTPPAAVDGPGADRHPRASRSSRSLPVFGYHDQHGHGEIVFTDVRVPATNLLGEEGGGFAIAQARLGPGRIHHCMRGHRHGRARARADGAARAAGAGRVRQAARRAGRGASSRSPSPGWRSSRPGCSPSRPRG